MHGGSVSHLRMLFQCLGHLSLLRTVSPKLEMGGRISLKMEVGMSPGCLSGSESHVSHQEGELGNKQQIGLFYGGL